MPGQSAPFYCCCLHAAAVFVAATASAFSFSISTLLNFDNKKKLNKIGNSIQTMLIKYLSLPALKPYVPFVWRIQEGGRYIRGEYGIMELVKSGNNWLRTWFFL